MGLRENPPSDLVPFALANPSRASLAVTTRDRANRRSEVVVAFFEARGIPMRASEQTLPGPTFCWRDEEYDTALHTTITIIPPGDVTPDSQTDVRPVNYEDDSTPWD